MAEAAVASRDDLIAEEDGNPVSQEINPLAILGSLLGASGIVAVENVSLVWLPLLALAVNVLAVRQIAKRSPAPVGRRAALAGAALALVFSISSPLVAWGQQRANRSQALAAAEAWFMALRQQQPEIAHQWTMPRWMRAAENESVTAKYATPNGRQALARFLDLPAVQTLLKLGKRAHVRYAGAESSRSDDETRTFVDRYSVSDEQASPPTRVLIELSVKARLDRLRRQWSWEVASAEIVADPAE